MCTGAALYAHLYASCTREPAMAFALKADVPPALFAQLAGHVALPISEASAQGLYTAAAKLLGEANVLETAARRAQKDGTDIDAERAKCATFMRLCREKGAGRDLLKPADVAAIQKKKNDVTRKRGRAHVSALTAEAAAAPKAIAGAIAAGAGADDADEGGSELKTATGAPDAAGAGAGAEDAKESGGARQRDSGGGSACDFKGSTIRRNRSCCLQGVRKSLRPASVTLGCCTPI